MNILLMFVAKGQSNGNVTVVKILVWIYHQIRICVMICWGTV